MENDHNIIDYIILRGLASEVEAKVKALINEGWSVRGEMHVTPPSSTTPSLVIQNMVLYNG